MEQASVGVDTQEQRNIRVVRQRRTQTHDAHRHLAGLHHAQGTSDDGLDDGAAFVCQQVHLIDDQQPH